jgi:NADPH2 dehydrogenase
MLFSPLRLRELELPNRIMVGPMGQYSAKDGSLGPWHLMHVGSLAVSGAGLVVIEATAVNPGGRLSPRDPGLWCDANEAALVPILDFCREFGGARIGLQLFHSGRKGSVTVAWEHQRVIPVEQGGWTPLAASALPYPKRNVPKPLDLADMRALIDDYVGVTQRSLRLGIDLLELHSAHGYLLHNFLSPLTNLRTDAYGGSLVNRMRFPLDVFKAVRDVWPKSKPFGVRISAVDWADGGWTLDDSVVYAKALQALGCDYITASSGGATPEQKITVGAGYQVPFADAIRSQTGMCTCAVGLITETQQAEDILRTGKADIIGLARTMLYNPRWPWHAAVELGEEFYYPKQYERAHPSMQGGDFLRPSRTA